MSSSTPKKSALEQAKSGSPDEGVLGNAARGLVEKVLSMGIDGTGPFESAAAVAAAASRKASSPEAAVDAVIRQHVRLAAAGGFLTSVGGFITLPVALPANVAGFYLLATRQVAAVAAVRGYDIRDPQIRTAVLLTLVGSEADDVLAKVGVAVPTGRLTALAAKNLSGAALMVVNKAIGFRILSTAGKKTLSRFGRNIPLVGGVIGGGLDAWLCHRIGVSARQEFPPQAAEIAAGPVA